MAMETGTIEIKQGTTPKAPLDEAVVHSYPISKLDHIIKLVPPITDTIKLGILRDRRLRVMSPITVEFTGEGEHIIAEAKELNEFGFGDNWTEALTDLRRTITELYYTLEESQETLGTEMQRVWMSLQQKVCKR